MQRRTLLSAAVAGALGSLAGCLTPPVADDRPQDEGADAPELPPVVDEDGTLVADAISERSLDVFQSTSYLWELSLRITDEGESILEESFTVAVDRDQQRASAVTTQRAPGQPDVRQDSYRTADGGMERFQQGDDDPQYGLAEETFEELIRDGVAGTFVRIVVPSIESHEFEPLEWDGDAFVAAVAESTTENGSTGELRLDEEGVLLELVIDGVETASGAATLAFRLSDIGSVSVEQPDWVTEVEGER